MCGTIVIKNYLNRTANNLITDLEDLKIKIGNKDNQESLIKNTDKIYKKWNNINNNWSNLVLHEEIDAIETSFIKLKAKIKVANLEESIENIDTLIFLINHIKEKEETSLKNIF